MKTMKLKRALSLLLSIVMVIGTVCISVSTVYAEVSSSTPALIEGDNTFDVDKCKVEWTRNVDSGFTSTVQKVSVENYIPPTPLDDYGSATREVYLAGKITIYVDKLPTSEDMTGDDPTAKVTFYLSDASAAVNWNGFDNPDYSPKNNFNNANGLGVTNFKYSDNYLKTSISASNTMYLRYTKDGIQYKFDYEAQIKELGPELTISDGSAVRNSKSGASVSLKLSSEANLYYMVSNEQLSNPNIDTSGQGIVGISGSNSFEVNDLTDCNSKYLYILAKSDSEITDPYEIVIPAMKFSINHDKQHFPGWAYQQEFFTECFKNTNGESITSATPGETVIVDLGVFEINTTLLNPVYSNGVFEYAGIKKHVLETWRVEGVILEQAPDENTYSFSFTMPEADVTIQAVTKAVGVPVSISTDSTDVDAELYLYAKEGSETGYNCNLQLDGLEADMVIPETDVLAYVFINNSRGYSLDRIDVYNNGVLVDESEVRRNIESGYYDHGNVAVVIKENGSYEFKAVFYSKAFAFITTTTDPSDASMGSASASVDSNTLVYEGETVTLTATPNEGYVLKDWQVQDDNGTVIPVTPDSEDPNKASFVMTADYSDEITATAVFEAEGQEEPTVEFRGHRLLLSGQIGVSFGVDLSELNDEQKAASYMEFTVNGKTTRVDTSDAVQESGLHIFTCFINSIQMAEPVTAIFHYGDDTVQNVYSVKEYISYIKEHESSFKPVEVALTKGIADYGHYAQPFLARTNNWTIGTDYEEMDLFFAQSYDYDAVKSAVEGKQLALTKGSSKVDTALMRLSLDSETAVTVRLTVKDNTALTASAAFHGKTYTAVKQSDGSYIITIPGITAAWLGDDITINGNADGEFTVTVSALSFVSSVLNSDTYADDAVAKNAVSALYYYYTTTMDYRAANGQ